MGCLPVDAISLPQFSMDDSLDLIDRSPHWAVQRNGSTETVFSVLDLTPDL